MWICRCFCSILEKWGCFLIVQNKRCHFLCGDSLWHKCNIKFISCSFPARALTNASIHGVTWSLFARSAGCICVCQRGKTARSGEHHCQMASVFACQSGYWIIWTIRVTDIHHKNIWQLRCIYPLRRGSEKFSRGLPRYLVATIIAKRWHCDYLDGQSNESRFKLMRFVVKHLTLLLCSVDKIPNSIILTTVTDA